MVDYWQETNRTNKLAELKQNLRHIGLTWGASSKKINETQVALMIGRLPNLTAKGEKDLVNVADVGFGVSQTLPVLVALLVAEPGQLVYLEQPEIHLHPKAQTAMAQVIANAAIRGVRVVVETHSNLLLLGIQTLVAEGKLAPEIVKLHWFERGEDGVTDIRSADLDASGSFGEWPEDFDDVTLEAQARYLDAAQARRRKK